MRAAIALAVALVAAPAQALALAEVAALLASVEASRARFTEVRTMSALATPIERSGTLAYARPGTLDMVVESPIFERLTVAQGKLTIAKRDTSMVIDLAAREPLFAWIEAIRATLAGDEASLHRFFNAEVSGTLPRWTLVLVPRDPRLRALVARIAIAGERERIRTIAIDEASGDRSVMTIVPDTAAR